MTRTADHVLFGRADLAGDATDSAHRPPMVERGGPRPDRGGGPLPPTSVGGFPRPLRTPPGGASRRRGSPPPPSPSPPPRPSSSPAEGAEGPPGAPPQPK